jgi:uncharacterized protein with NRDE domain
MCIVFFRKNPPVRGIKRVILFNRDEAILRERTPLGVHFSPQRILCGVDLEAKGTWLGVNLDTGNYGFLTNYGNKPFHVITDTRYRRGNLLMTFLLNDKSFNSPKDYQEYLENFIEEGDKFNGLNIWLGNLLHTDEHTDQGG